MAILIKIHNEHASSLEARLKTRKRIEHEIFSNLAKTQEYRIRCQVLTGERFYFVTVFKNGFLFSKKKKGKGKYI